MGGERQIRNLFKPAVRRVPKTPLGSAGYDNARENIDPHIKTKVLNAIELLIQRAKLLGKTAGSVLFLDSNVMIAEDNSKLFWDNVNKRLGIGTAAPLTPLHVKKNDGSNIQYITIDNAGLGQGIGFNYGNTQLGQIAHTLTGGRWFIRHKLWNGSSQTECFTSAISATQVRLGISQSNPEETLHMSSERPVIRIHNTTQTDDDEGREGILSFVGEQSGGEDESIAQVRATHDGISDDQKGNLIFATNDGNDAMAPTERMRVDSVGNVGIGTAAPGDSLPNLFNPIVNSKVIEVKGASILADSGILLRRSDGLVGIDVWGDSSIGNVYIDHRHDSAGSGIRFRNRTEGTLVNSMVITGAGNVGIGTISPTLPLDVKAKSGHTAIGGFAIKLTNKTGANSVAGELVETSIGTANAVQLSNSGSLEAMGVFLDAGVSDGSEAWVVISGIAEALADTGGFSMGDWLRSGTAGRVTGGAHVPNPVFHMAEIGHALEDAGANTLGKVILHFN